MDFDLFNVETKVQEMEDCDMNVFFCDADLATCGPVDLQDYVDELLNGDEWLQCVSENPILNDRMISDAVAVEHSYSISDNARTDGTAPSESCLRMAVADSGAANARPPSNRARVPGQAMTSRPSHAVKLEPGHIDSRPFRSQQSKLSLHPVVATGSPSCGSSSTVIHVTKPHSLLNASPSTSGNVHSVRLTQHAKSTATGSGNKIHIKLEPIDANYDSDQPIDVETVDPSDSPPLPPTPPSSSDSDGSQSPERGSCSSSFSSQLSASSGHPTLHSQLLQPQRVGSPNPHDPCYPFLTNLNKLPASGPLLLTEEEKRTLIQEGYPIPSKLPLTKAEEKILKKIRRKIKNKISAQESRRKKKEYVDALEKKVETYCNENSELRRKVESLENSNRSLLSQLQKLQSIVNKVSRGNGNGSSSTGTCLMVLVLCFALFFGGSDSLEGVTGWSPLGKCVSVPFVSSYWAKAGPVDARAFAVGIGDPLDPHTTPNIRSRVLMSIADEGDTGGDLSSAGEHELLSSQFSHEWSAEEGHDGGEEDASNMTLLLPPDAAKLNVIGNSIAAQVIGLGSDSMSSQAHHHEQQSVVVVQ